MNAQIEHSRPTRAESGASANEIESALSANREAIEHTLTELQQRVSAEGLTQMAMERLRSESGMQFMRGMRDTVVHNPMPITVIALGIVWAAMSERGESTTRRAVEPSRGGERDELGESVQESAGRIRHRASARWGEARERTREMVDRGRERFSRSGERQGSMVGAGEASARGWEFTREHPILMAGAGVAVGAALAAMLPTTRVERERVGPVRDEAFRGGARFASEAGRGAAAGTATEAGVTEGEPPRATERPEETGGSREWSTTERPVEAEPSGQSERTETTEGPADRPA